MMSANLENSHQQQALATHLEEWIDGSCVAPELATLNVESLEVNKEITSFLGWKSYKGESGWVCRGVDPLSGQKNGRFGQFKPDKPITFQDGRTAKYLTAKGIKYDALCLAVTGEIWESIAKSHNIEISVEDRKLGFWNWILSHPEIPLLITEGAKKAGAGISLNLPSLALFGVWMGQADKIRLVPTLKRFATPGRLFVLGFDSDIASKTGVFQALTNLAHLLAKPGCEVRVASWDEEFKGMDDFIKAKGKKAFLQVVAAALPYESWRRDWEEAKKKESARTEITEDLDDSRFYLPPIEKIFTQKAEEALYSGERWISVGDQLYKWVGTHYKLQPEKAEKRRISNWLNTYVEEVGKGLWKYTRANSSSIEAVYSWIIGRFGVDPAQINPPGLNCQNGILKIHWKSEEGYPIAHWELKPHNPENFYTYCSEIPYDPKADQTDCNRLLEALDPPQRKIFLQTIAASLDLPTIRKYRGRMIRLLLFYGTGNNGKDALRSALGCVLGGSLSACSLSDFQLYDQGRKFAIAKLESSRCNWSSENTSFASLDAIQSIKQFATGDPLDIERKFQDAYEIIPSAIGLFNCNDPPSIKGGLEAVQSRWAVIKSDKTFKLNADPSKGEIEADPRFKYDPDFIRSRVAPALLNQMLEALRTLVKDGIDFAACQEAFREIQEDSCHLWQFCRDAGLRQEVGGRVFINDLWEKLRQWYIDTGTLEVQESDNGKEKLTWHDFPNKYDRPIKASNQIHARIAELFPKITKQRHTERLQSPEKLGQWYLLHLGFGEVEKVPESAGDQVRDPLNYLLKAWQGLPQESRQMFMNAIKPHSPTSPIPQAEHPVDFLSFKVGDKVESQVSGNTGQVQIANKNGLSILWEDAKKTTGRPVDYTELSDLKKMKIVKIGEADFKIGDRVELLKKTAGERPVGDQGVITETSNSWLTVTWDNPSPTEFTSFGIASNSIRKIGNSASDDAVHPIPALNSKETPKPASSYNKRFKQTYEPGDLAYVNMLSENALVDSIEGEYIAVQSSLGRARVKPSDLLGCYLQCEVGDRVCRHASEEIKGTIKRKEGGKAIVCWDDGTVTWESTTQIKMAPPHVASDFPPAEGSKVISVAVLIEDKGKTKWRDRCECTVKSLINGEARTDTGFNISRWAWEKGLFIPVFPGSSAT